jgi:hypothetical protein
MVAMIVLDMELRTHVPHFSIQDQRDVLAVLRRFAQVNSKLGPALAFAEYPLCLQIIL